MISVLGLCEKVSGGCGGVFVVVMVVRILRVVGRVVGRVCCCSVG